MRRRAKAETNRHPGQEEPRHDVAKRAWSDEPMSVVPRLKAGVTDLQSRLNAESLRLEPQPSLSSHLRQPIEAARDLIPRARHHDHLGRQSGCRFVFHSRSPDSGLPCAHPPDGSPKRASDYQFQGTGE
jgi:hypothetical protein